MNETEIETALQNAAPRLPESLQAQTLRSCRLSVEAREQKYRRTQRKLWGAVVAVCALHWLVVGQLDAQNARWVNGDNVPLQTRVASDESSQNSSPIAFTAFGWRTDMRERKFALSSLMNEPNEMTR